MPVRRNGGKNPIYSTTPHIPQRTLKHQTPIQALQKWLAEKPDLFV
jgi:hypothetical protein